MRSKSYKQSVMLRAKKAFVAAANAYDQANRDVISEPSHWEGFEGRTTHRKSGETVKGAFRNIKDLNNLGGSQTMTISGGTATYSWDGNGQTPPAEVFFGRRTRTSYVPGRRWTERALDNVDLAKVFSENF